MNLSILYKKLTNRKHTIGYKFILSLFVGFVGLINFGYCEEQTVEDLISVISEGTYTAGNNWSSIADIDVAGSYCIYFEPITSYDSYLKYWAEYPGYNGGVYMGVYPNSWGCIGAGADNLNFFVAGNGSVTFNYKIIEVNELLATALPKMTSLECQSEYSLLPISEIDTNYCVGNGLCPDSGDNWSALYINDIQYPGAPTIKFTIPEEIERDQNTDEEETNIDVIGYGYDQDKMQQMVNTQYYKPTAEEMSGLMKKVADFLPLVAVALLIARIRRVIKKVF